MGRDGGGALGAGENVRTTSILIGLQGRRFSFNFMGRGASF